MLWAFVFILGIVSRVISICLLLNIANNRAFRRKACSVEMLELLQPLSLSSFSPSQLVSKKSLLQYHQQLQPPQHPCLIIFLISPQKVIRTRNHTPPPLTLSFNPNLLWASHSYQPNLTNPQLLILVMPFQVNKVIFSVIISTELGLGQLTVQLIGQSTLIILVWPFLEKNFPNLLKPNMNTSWSLTGCLNFFRLIDMVHT